MDDHSERPSTRFPLVVDPQNRGEGPLSTETFLRDARLINGYIEPIESIEGQDQGDAWVIKRPGTVVYNLRGTIRILPARLKITGKPLSLTPPATDACGTGYYNTYEKRVVGAFPASGTDSAANGMVIWYPYVVEYNGNREIWLIWVPSTSDTHFYPWFLRMDLVTGEVRQNTELTGAGYVDYPNRSGQVYVDEAYNIFYFFNTTHDGVAVPRNKITAIDMTNPAVIDYVSIPAPASQPHGPYLIGCNIDFPIFDRHTGNLQVSATDQLGVDAVAQWYADLVTPGALTGTINTGNLRDFYTTPRYACFSDDGYLYTVRTGYPDAGKLFRWTSWTLDANNYDTITLTTTFGTNNPNWVDELYGRSEIITTSPTQVTVVSSGTFAQVRNYTMTDLVYEIGFSSTSGEYTPPTLDKITGCLWYVDTTYNMNAISTTNGIRWFHSPEAEFVSSLVIDYTTYSFYAVIAVATESGTVNQVVELIIT